jgi:ribA/ribD-fused uncharacterized protein
MESINSFTKEYQFLSNTYNSPIEIDGISYTNAESAFWAQRVKDSRARNKFSRLSGNKARAKAIQAEPVEDWDENINHYMEKVLKAKFSDPKMMKLLNSTKGCKLINTNTYRDDYWGVYMGKGKNVLGRLLMKIRDEV